MRHWTIAVDGTVTDFTEEFKRQLIIAVEECLAEMGGVRLDRLTCYIHPAPPFSPTAVESGGNVG